MLTKELLRNNQDLLVTIAKGTFKILNKLRSVKVWYWYNKKYDIDRIKTVLSFFYGLIDAFKAINTLTP